MATKKIFFCLEIVLKGVVFLSGLFFVLCFFYMVSKRLFYPFELEWLEGYFLSAIVRVINGKTLYPAPNETFVPFLYPPVYYWVCGLLAKMFGPVFWVPRAVSFFSSVLSGLLIYKFVFIETRSRFVAFTAVGLFFACYGISDFWYDLARVDSLFLLFLLSGLFLVKYHNSSFYGLFFSIIMLSLAFYTKQAAVFFIVSCFFYLLRLKKNKAFFFLFLCSFVLLSAFFVMNRLTDGWFWFYSYTVPFKHYGLKELTENPALFNIYKQYSIYAQQDYSSIKKLYFFFWKDLLFNFPVLLLFISGMFFLRIKHIFENKTFFFFTITLGAAFCASISMRCKLGGHVNGIIPSVVILIICFAIIAGYIIQKFHGWRVFVFILIVFQFFLLKYNPLRHTPTEADYKAGEKIIRMISSFSGDVYLPFHSFYPYIAGKKMFVHKMPLDDIFVGFSNKFPASLFLKIRNQGFDAIFYDFCIDKNSRNPLEKHILNYYTAPVKIIYNTKKLFFPLSGFRIRPSFVYLPKTCVKKED